MTVQKVTRRSMFSGILGVLTLGLVKPAEATQHTPAHGLRERIPNYPEPENAVEAWYFLAAHCVTVREVYDYVKNEAATMLTWKIGKDDYYISYVIRNNREYSLTEIFSDYILPACISIHRHIYGK